MSILIDLLIVAIIVYCAWQGLKKGLVNSAFGIFALIVAVFFGHIFATVYGNEFSNMFNPFATGLIDNAISTVADVQETDATTYSLEGAEEAEAPVIILTESEKSDVYSVSYAALRQLGIAEKSAEAIAVEVAEDNTVVDQEMAIDLTAKLCDRIAYVLVLGIVFTIVAIIAAIIGNVLNLYFKLPNLETANKISGSVLGAVKGIIIVMFIACFCRYFGLILGQETISDTWLLEFFINHNGLANTLGM